MIDFDMAQIVDDDTDACPYPTVNVREIEAGIHRCWDVGVLILWLDTDPRVGARAAYRARLKELRAKIAQVLHRDLETRNE